MVQSYLAHENVVLKNPSSSHFDPALKIFVRQEFTIQIHQEDRTEDTTRTRVCLEDLLTRLKLLKDMMTARNERYGCLDQEIFSSINNLQFFLTLRLCSLMYLGLSLTLLKHTQGVKSPGSIGITPSTVHLLSCLRLTHLAGDTSIVHGMQSKLAPA